MGGISTFSTNPVPIPSEMARTRRLCLGAYVLSIPKMY